MLKKLLYLVYYYKELDKKKFQKFFNYVVDNHNIPRVNLWKDILTSSLKHNISLLDFFYFKFYERNEDDRKKWAGTGYLYEYQLKTNPKDEREILENKLLFLEQYSKFINHNYSSKDVFLKNKDVADQLLSNRNNKLVLKSSDGQCGVGIEILDLKKNQNDWINEKIMNTENDLIEEFITQHDDLMNLSPSGLNTIRIFTQLNKQNKVDILGCRLRITINSTVDNLAAGNIAAPINEKTGLVYSPGVYSDITKSVEEFHPVTGIKIVGFQIPYWKESLQMVKEAALLHPQNRSIGWDVAITNDGPELLEGNHNWCKLLWQLPVKKGLKQNLVKYLL